MATIHLHHDQHFDLVLDESDTSGNLAVDQVRYGGQVYASLGQYDVQSGDGVERRHKIAVSQPGGYTTVIVPAEHGSGQRLVDLLDALRDRHSEQVTAVSGDDPKMVGRIAAMLDVPVREAADV